ncbi:Protein FAR-RED ELONGATED HYPOCOTYL [Arachis hypogaea]|nr:Protein FAR-RED ELONGATED HYPOCOTYL [Arachis hypogaea]
MRRECMEVSRNRRLVNYTRQVYHITSMDTSIFEEASYDIAYNVSEHYNSTDVNVLSLSEDDTPLVEQEKESEDVIQRKDDATVSNNEFLDHNGISIEEISYVGLRFNLLQWAQEFYSNYAKKVGFVTRIRNTNFDKTRKELKVPINQSIHFSREGYRESQVKAATRVKRITTAGCKARMYVMLDRQKDNWMVSKLELKHTHTCSAKQAVHYSEYRELTMHTKCVIQNNDKAGIRPNKTYTDERGWWVIKVGLLRKGFDVDETNKFKSALWVDARCRASYEYFGDVVSFDTTYSRNKYVSLPPLYHKSSEDMLGTEKDAKMHGTVWNACSEESFEKDWFVVQTFMTIVKCGFQYIFKVNFELFVHEYDNMLGNKEQKELEDDAADSKGVVPCSLSSTIERQFHHEYTTSKFREVQHEFRKRGDCLVRGVT